MSGLETAEPGTATTAVISSSKRGAEVTVAGPASPKADGKGREFPLI
jgi:hypothetical protein